MSLPFIVAMSGASGAVYGVEIVRALKAAGRTVHLVVTESAARTLTIETAYSLDDVRRIADLSYSNKDVGATIASGSFLTAGMVVAPCSIKSLSAIANSYSSNLLTRAADVTLKEGRKLILMVRETPLHKGHLELMMKAADLGAVIMPPMPAFYHRPASLDDIVAQGVAKVLDQFGVEHQLSRRWEGPDS